MRITFALTSAGFSGGRLVILNHANSLARRGHQVTVALQSDPTGLSQWACPPTPPIRFVSGDDLPPSDVIVFDRPRLARMFANCRTAVVCHYCQGYEGIDAERRIAEAVKRWGRILSLPTQFKLRKRLREVEDAYRQPTVKFAISRLQCELLKRKFAVDAHLIPPGISDGLFRPAESLSFRPSTVLMVATLQISCKRVRDGLRAVQLLKKKRPDLRLIRIAGQPQTDEEISFGVTDEYHQLISQEQMAELYRRSDALLFVSDENEGFGLPSIEAMASGVPCVLTRIPSFMGYANHPADYAKFVPVGDSMAMAEKLDEVLTPGAERERLIERGIEVSAGYRWSVAERVMEETLTMLVDGNRSRESKAA